MGLHKLVNIFARHIIGRQGDTAIDRTWPSFLMIRMFFDRHGKVP